MGNRSEHLRSYPRPHPFAVYPANIFIYAPFTQSELQQAGRYQTFELQEPKFCLQVRSCLIFF